MDNSNKRKKEKHPRWKKLLYVVAIVIALCFMGIGIYQTEIEKKGSLSIFIGIAITVFDIFFALLIANLEKDKGTEQYIDIPNDVLGFFKMVATAFKCNLLVRVGAFACVFYIVGSILGTIGIIDICQDVTYAILHHEEFEPPVEKPSENKIDVEYIQKPELDSEDKEWFDRQDPEVVSRVEGLKVSLLEIETIRALANDDADLIFFLNGKYKINNWDDETEIQEKVRLFINDYYKMKKKNQFDNEAGQDLHDEVFHISDIETTIVLFSERKDNMERRQDIYNLFPKADLAMLISNDEHILALTLFRNGGNESSIQYYYAKAIEYRMKRITFEEISEDSLKSNIEWMSARYADIVYTCPNSEYKMYAEELRDAFYEIAKEY